MLLGLVILFICIVIIILYEDKKESYTQINNKKIETNNVTDIKNTRNNRNNRNNKITEFIFEIQELYIYSPLLYDEFISSLNSFIKIYDNVFANTAMAHYNYQLAESEQRNVLDKFQSIMLNAATNNNKVLLNKLEKILNIYMKDLYYECMKIEHTYGLNMLTRPINIGPAEYNTN